MACVHLRRKGTSKKGPEVAESVEEGKGYRIRGTG